MKKRIVVLITGILYLNFLSAQLPEDDIADIRQLKVEDLTSAYPTVTKEGKVLCALSVSEVKVHSKRCLPEPVKMYFHASSDKPFKNIGWYKWNTADKYWQLLDKPKYVKANTTTEGHYIEEVSCPGVYGFFVKPVSRPKGVFVRVPFNCKIQSVRIVQNFPSAIVYHWKAKSKVRKVRLPIGDLRFDGEISMQVVDQNGKELALEPVLLGKFLDFSKPLDKGDYRKMVVRSKDMIVKTETGSL